MTEFKDKTKKELEKMLDDKQIALKNFRFGISGSKIKNMCEGRNLKKEIAQIMTALQTAENK